MIARVFRIRFLKCIFLLYISHLHSFSFSKDTYESIAKDVPDWIYEQIDSDLNNCELNRKIEDEYKYLQSNFYNKRLVFFRILNNKITYKVAKKSLHPVTVKEIHYMLDFFNEASQYITFPDVDFIVFTLNRIEPYIKQCKLSNYELNLPIFVRSKKKSISTGILIPALRNFFAQEDYLPLLEAQSETVKWETKINQFFWRGRPTGYHYKDGSNPRLRLIQESLSNTDILDAAFVKDKSLMKRHPTVDWSNLKFSKEIDQAEQINYKYLIAVQGSSYPSSLHWQLFSNSLMVLVDTPYLEWYYSGMVPFKHYVPLKDDYSDLREILIWLQENDSKAEEIAKNATEFYKNQVSNERIIHFFYLLLCRYKEKFQEYVEPSPKI